MVGDGHEVETGPFDQIDRGLHVIAELLLRIRAVGGVEVEVSPEPGRGGRVGSTGGGEHRDAAPGRSDQGQDQEDHEDLWARCGSGRVVEWEWESRGMGVERAFNTLDR